VACDRTDLATETTIRFSGCILGAINRWIENVKLLKSNGDLLIEASPEKAGVGGSTPSLATMFSIG
jgi:hypothetical protein